MKSYRTRALSSGRIVAAGALFVMSLQFPAVAGAQEGADEIDTIVVTARKREEALQEIPVAVTAFTEQTLLDRQVRDLNDIARFSPGLNFAKAFGRTTERPVIRGLGNVLAGVQFGVESGAAYFVDGVYYPGDLQSLNIDDVERVEVIRGPQSALYGRNTYSGAINFITKSPAEVAELDTGLRFGQDGEMQFDAGISGQLIDGVLGGRLTGRYYSFDGEYTNIVTGNTVGDEETRSVSSMLEWNASEDLRVRTRLSLQKDDDGTRPFFLQSAELNNCYPGTRSMGFWNKVTGSSNFNQYYCGEINRPADYVALNDGPAAGPIPELPGVPAGGNTQSWLNCIPGTSCSTANSTVANVYDPRNALAFSGVERDLKYASILADWDMGGSGWILSGSAAFRDEERRAGSDSDHSQVNRIPADDPTGLDGNPAPYPECNFCGSDMKAADDYSLEVRLTSPVEERLRWMLGAFLYNQEIDTRDIRFADATRTATSFSPISEKEETDNWALFGMVEFDFTDTLSAGLELRWFDEEKSLWQSATEVQPVGSAFDETAEFDEVAPRVTVDWQLTPDVLLYAVYAKGFKPGGLNGKAGATAVPAAPDYAQEESDNYELGAKTTWLDGTLIANASVFFIDAQDIQLTTALVSSSGILTSIVTNQAAGESKGIELELSYLLTENVTVGANYALADTEFTEGCDEFQYILTSGGGLLNPNAATPCTGNDLTGDADGSIEGNQFPLSAKNMASAYADYRQPLANDWEFFVNADVSWEDEKPVQVHNLAWVPDATLVNAQIGFDTGPMTISFYGRNLTDEDAPSMVTRWIQDPVASGAAGGGGGSTPFQAGCSPFPPTCSTSYPRAFFGDMRRGRNFGVEFNYRFGGAD